MLPFADRRTAGRLLAEELKGFSNERTVVLGLPRGGVAVAREVTRMLDVPLDVIVTRKIGYPVQPELGVGAIAEGGAGPVFDDGLLERLGLTPEDLTGVVAAEEAELARRVRVYRGDRPPPDVTGRGVIVVDDGLATGVTARAALRSLRAAGAGSVVLAVPVAPPSAAEAMRDEADKVVFLVTPRLFSSVGEWYTSFGQLSDADVLALLTPEQDRGRLPPQWGNRPRWMLRRRRLRRRSRGACAGGARPSAPPRSGRPTRRTSPAGRWRSSGTPAAPGRTGRSPWPYAP